MEKSDENILISPQIFQLIPKIMGEIDFIAKDRKNVQQGFQFRGIDDVYNTLHSLLAKHGVFTVPEVLSEVHEERKTQKGGVLIYRILKMKYTFFAPDGSHIECIVIGEGMDSGDKASNKAMAVAHKYAFLQVFAIPTAEEKDPDAESHKVMHKEKDRVTPAQKEKSFPSADSGPSEPNYEGSPPAMTDKQRKYLFVLTQKAKLTKEETKEFFDWHLKGGDKTVAWASEFIDSFVDILAEWFATKMDEENWNGLNNVYRLEALDLEDEVTHQFIADCLIEIRKGM